jgi:type I restriction enzyme S subunit
MILDDLYNISKGKKPPELSTHPSDNSIPFIQINGIRDASQNSFCLHSPDLVTCNVDDLLIVWDGAYCGLVGFGLQGAIGSTIARLRPKRKNVFPAFAGRFLQSKFAEIQENSTGAAIPHINGRHLRNIEIPLPSMGEQRRIAAVLDKADTLRRQRQESLQLTEKLLQSVFLDMFGDPATNPREWETVPLEELCERIVDCPHSTPIYSEQPTGYYCVRSSDVQNGKLDLRSTRHVSESVYQDRIARHEPKKGEVIYTREGGRLGYAAQVPTDTKVCLGQRMMLFSAKDNIATNAFLASLLNADSFRRRILNLVGGGAAPRVNIKDLRAISVYAPPFNLQERYESFAAKLNDEEEAIQQSQRIINFLFSSLQQKAFRGELDLSRLQLAPEAESPAVTPVQQPIVVEGRFAITGGGIKSFIAPADIERQLLAMEKKLEGDKAEPLPWSEDFFKYRTLSQILQPPYSFASIWSAVEQDFAEPEYETVKNKVFEYVAAGVLKQEFNEEQREILFKPRT